MSLCIHGNRTNRLVLSFFLVLRYNNGLRNVDVVTIPKTEQRTTKVKAGYFRSSRSYGDKLAYKIMRNIAIGKYIRKYVPDNNSIVLMADTWRFVCFSFAALFSLLSVDFPKFL